MPQQIQIRRGTAAAWTSANPILALGEQGLETDTKKFKFGDGLTHWNDLEYASASDPTTIITTAVVNGFSLTATAEVNQFHKLVPAATIAGGTFTFPALADLTPSQEFILTTAETITSLALVAGSGTTVSSASIAPFNAGSTVACIYDAEALEITVIPPSAVTADAVLDAIGDGSTIDEGYLPAGYANVVPLELTAPPEDGVEGIPNYLETNFTDNTNNDLRFEQVDPDAPPTIEFVQHGSFDPVVLVTVVGAAIEISFRDSIGISVATANQVIAAVELSAAASALVSVTPKPGNDGTGVVGAAGAVFGPTALSGGVGAVDGTTATALGQLAIVTTTNDSGTFEDVWTCSNTSPMTWQPPGQITRSPDGTLYRATVSDAGVIGNELAYP